jgi:hypothetical protein
VFTVQRRGYDPQQVDAHLRRLDAEIRILVADRDAAVDQAAQLARELDEARLRADRLRTQVRTMAGRPSDVQGMSERMRTMLRLAEDEVADMLRRADTEVARRLAEADAIAEQVVGGAEREAAEVRAAARAAADATAADAARLRAETEAACAAEHHAIADERAAAARAIEAAAAQAEKDRARAWSESEARRTVVEEDFTIAMDQRRAEALADVQAERARIAEWVRRTGEETTRQVRAELAAAEETARRIVAAAQARVDELSDVRARVAAQLRGTRVQLGETLEALAPEAVEAPAPIRAAPARPAAPVGGAATGSIAAPPRRTVLPAPTDTTLPAPEPATALPAPPATSSARPETASPSGPPASAGPPAPEPEPETQPVPVTVPEPRTLVLEAPPGTADAGEPKATRTAQMEPIDVTDSADDPESAETDEGGPDQSVDQPGPSTDARPPNSRRRKRRSSAGASHL